jgi:hypothetical protein
MAVVGADAELVDHLEAVLAPVLDVDQRVVERRAVVALEAVALAQVLGGGEHVGVTMDSSRRANSVSVR